MRTATLFAAAALGVTGLASAVEATTDKAMAGMDHGGAAMGQMMATMDAMMAAMDTMMGAMPTESTGMVDADFLLMMIPHHQSAIDMARIELENGADAETRAIAQGVIDAQEVEIAQMRAMLERMGVEAAPAE